MYYHQYLTSKIGKPVFFTTIGHSYHGIVKEVNEDYVVLSPWREVEKFEQYGRSGPIVVNKVEANDDLIVQFHSIYAEMNPSWINDGLEVR